jgi:hypothetical protein
MDTIR